jgi:hypothetical protein
MDHPSAAHPTERADPATPASPDQGSSIPQNAETEIAALRERQREIMELLGTRSPEKILHDLRNLINEVNLLRVLMETDEKQ